MVNSTLGVEEDVVITMSAGDKLYCARKQTFLQGLQSQ